MLNKRDILVLAAMIAVGVFFLWLSFTFYPPQTHHHNYQSNYESASSIDVIPEHGIGAFLRKYADVVTGIATGLLAYITYRLVVLGREQSETARAELRAYVFATGVIPEFDLLPVNGHYNWRLRPEWTNHGSTQTRKLRLYSDCELRTTTLPVGFPFTEKHPFGTGLLPPHVSMNGGSAPILQNPAITPQDILDVIAGHKFLYLWGWARYFDVFPGTQEHITRFCFQITPGGNPTTFAPGQSATQHGNLRFGYVHHAEGNCADDECGN